MRVTHDQAAVEANLGLVLDEMEAGEKLADVGEDLGEGDGIDEAHGTENGELEGRERRPVGRWCIGVCGDGLGVCWERGIGGNLAHDDGGQRREDRAGAQLIVVRIGKELI